MGYSLVALQCFLRCFDVRHAFPQFSQMRFDPVQALSERFLRLIHNSILFGVPTLTAVNSRVGRAVALPLVKPDWRFSRIRLP